MGGAAVTEDSALRSRTTTTPASIVTRTLAPLFMGIGVLLPGVCAQAAAAASIPPPASFEALEQFPEPPRTGGDFGYVTRPIARTGVGIHVNMHVVRTTNLGWQRFEEMVEVARAGGFYLFLNNLDGARGTQHVAATFDNWTFEELTTFASIISGSRVPILMYVGAVEVDGVMFVVGPDRLLSWHADVTWLRSVTGANAGLVIDAGSLGVPDMAPGGGTFLWYYSLYARIMATMNIEVGFEAIRLDNQDRPLEDRRYYGLLQFITDRFATIPPGIDFDARIMSAIDALPASKTDLINTVWLENHTWNELGDGDDVPMVYLQAWGLSSPAGLQAAAAARLFDKGYGLVFPPESFGID